MFVVPAEQPLFWYMIISNILYLLFQYCLLKPGIYYNGFCLVFVMYILNHVSVKMLFFLLRERSSSFLKLKVLLHVVAYFFARLI